MRMRLNVGPGKSAVMAYGRGGLSKREKRARLYIGEKKMELVATYKYLGLVISRGRGWAESIRAIANKCRKQIA